MTPQHRRLLSGWSRAQKLGLSPGQFLILADLVEHATEHPPASVRRRSQRLAMSHTSIQQAQVFFKDLGLVTLEQHRQPVFHGALHRSYPVLVAIPTVKALRLFNPYLHTSSCPSGPPPPANVAAIASGARPRPIPPAPTKNAAHPTTPAAA